MFPLRSRWTMSKLRFPIGAHVTGVIIRVEPFGVFVAIPECEVHAVLLVTEFEDGTRSFNLSDYPQVGTLVSAIVVDHVEHNHQLRLSTRASR